MNTAIELRDSKLTEVTHQESTMTLLFQPACLHKSDGRPGLDPGTVWLQDLRLVFLETALDGSFPELPARLTEGQLVMEGETHRNPFPLPSRPSGPIELRFSFDAQGPTTIVAKSLKVETIDEPLYLRLFNP